MSKKAATSSSTAVPKQADTTKSAKVAQKADKPVTQDKVKKAKDVNMTDEPVEAPKPAPAKKVKEAKVADAPVVEEVVPKQALAKKVKEAKVAEVSVEEVVPKPAPVKKAKETKVAEAPVVEEVAPKQPTTKKAKAPSPATTTAKPVEEVAQEKTKDTTKKSQNKDAKVSKAPVVDAPVVETPVVPQTPVPATAVTAVTPATTATPATAVASTESRHIVHPERTLKKTQVWFDIQATPIELGRVYIELYPDCPLAFENFRALSTGEVIDPVTKQQLCYEGTQFDYLGDDYIVGGEIYPLDDDNEQEVLPTEDSSDDDDDDDNNNTSTKDATGKKVAPMVTPYDPTKPARSIYGSYFKDEEAGLSRKHDKIGTVSMFSERTHRNGSKFLITMKPNMTWLDGQYVVIGRVVKGMPALFNMLEYKENTCIISDCGRYKKGDNNNKQNPLIQQTLKELGIDDKNKNTKNDNKDTDKKPVLCPKCNKSAKYNMRVLGKGLRYRCRDNKCSESFWINDDKITPDIAQVVIAKTKELKQAVAASENAQNDNDNSDNDDVADSTQEHKLNTNNIPGIHHATRALAALDAVQAFKAKAQEKYELAKKDHAEYVEKKQTEREEAKAASTQTHQYGAQRQRPGQQRDGGRPQPSVTTRGSTGDHRSRLRTAPGPNGSKTPKQNLNKRSSSAKPAYTGSKPSFAGRSSPSSSSSSRPSNNKRPYSRDSSDEPSKKKVKTRWTSRDSSQLPEGYVSRRERRAAQTQAQ